MQAGNSASGAGRDYLRRHGARTCLRLLALTTAVLVVGCASRTKPAPIAHLSANEVSANEAREPAQRVVAPPVATSYTVVAGDTLSSIARRHDSTVDALVRLNQIDHPDSLHIGQVLRLSAPSAATVKQAVQPPTGTTSAGAAPVAQTPSNANANASPTSTTNTTPGTAPSTTATSSTTPTLSTSTPRASDANLIRWDWPASGRVLQVFNVNTKGIDLEGKIGDPVKAAANGTVMYAGNGVRGLGNLILLGHSNGFISAYAHNQVLMVKTGQQIKQGAQIATIGQSDTTSPRLHFEIRRSGTPVNPLSYLPAR